MRTTDFNPEERLPSSVVTQTISSYVQWKSTESGFIYQVTNCSFHNSSSIFTWTSLLLFKTIVLKQPLNISLVYVLFLKYLMQNYGSRESDSSFFHIFHILFLSSSQFTSIVDFKSISIWPGFHPFSNTWREILNSRN